ADFLFDCSQGVPEASEALMKRGAREGFVQLGTVDCWDGRDYTTEADVMPVLGRRPEVAEFGAIEDHSILGPKLVEPGVKRLFPFGPI
ncbi:hypothetical protein Ancab_018807, partial [Ancistrocladus abbreviatus]